MNQFEGFMVPEYVFSPKEEQIENREAYKTIMDSTYDKAREENKDKVKKHKKKVPQNRTNYISLNSTPFPLLHCKIELLTTTSEWEQANLYFTDVATTANLIYCNLPQPNFEQFYALQY